MVENGKFRQYYIIITDTESIRRIDGGILQSRRKSQTSGTHRTIFVHKILFLTLTTYYM